MLYSYNVHHFDGKATSESFCPKCVLCIISENSGVFKLLSAVLPTDRIYIPLSKVDQ